MVPSRSNGQWGGARPNAGRPRLPAHLRKGVPHLARDKFKAAHPIHVTVRLRRGLPMLRTQKVYKELCQCFAAACDRFGFRIVHYSVQSNHLHLMCEAKDSGALSRGMQGLLIRVAKALNRLWKRRGSVFTERYHVHILRTPLEVREALAYILNNISRHTRRAGGRREGRIDEFASGAWFDGWKTTPAASRVAGATVDPPVATPCAWLLQIGWRRRGLIGIDEVPGDLRPERERR